jgi:hypothetical protein
MGHPMKRCLLILAALALAGCGGSGKRDTAAPYRGDVAAFNAKYASSLARLKSAQPRLRCVVGHDPTYPARTVIVFMTDPAHWIEYEYENGSYVNLITPPPLNPNIMIEPVDATGSEVDLPLCSISADGNVQIEGASG